MSRTIAVMHEPFNIYQQGFKVFLAIVFAAAISGYFSGLRQAPSRGASPPSDSRDAHATSNSSHKAPRAASYAELRSANLGPNRDFRPSLDELPPPEKINSRKKYPRYSDDDILLALADRAERRAFDGAPPVVPHPITQLGSESCLACHSAGSKVGDSHAPKICHQHLTNCTQCHAEGHRSMEAPPETLASMMAENDFVGLEAPLHGERASRTAPPIIPHTTWMRNDCVSCHGPSGRNAIQTRHPYRQNCMQCHAPTAQLEQQPASAGLRENPLRP
jgi:cytochrome c-type protein NapB